MGSSKETVTTTQTTTPQQTEEMRELNKLDLELRRQTQPQLAQLQAGALDLGSLLVRGQQLPGYLQGLPGGISPQVTSELAGEAIQDIAPYFQQAGLLDSGVRASVSARTAGDIRRQSEQFNIQNLSQLLNLAIGGQAQVQQPVIGQSGQLGQRLLGLTPISTAGTQIGRQNKSFFDTAFMGGIGQGAGAAAGTAIFGCWVASEIFGGWLTPKAVASRVYINTKAPVWFKKFYLKYGEIIAKFISDKPILKMVLKPLFEVFARKGQSHG